MVLSRPEILVSRAVKPRLVWRQLDQGVGTGGGATNITCGLPGDAVLPLQVYLGIRSSTSQLTATSRWYF